MLNVLQNLYTALFYTNFHIFSSLDSRGAKTYNSQNKLLNCAYKTWLHLLKVALFV